ncbi:MAG: hypothetical protein VX908_05400 [Planctomycetota bacterium]|nr:hypothetical protein [Planctomycetota bacterium]
MSVSDLQKLGLLKPESEWSGKGVGRSAAPLRSLFLGAIAIAGCVAMVVGDGMTLTWFGLIAFCAALACFVVVHIREVGTPDQPDEADQPDSSSPGS